MKSIDIMTSHAYRPMWSHVLTMRCRQLTIFRIRRATRFAKWSSSCSAVSSTIALGRNPTIWFVKFWGQYAVLKKKVKMTDERYVKYVLGVFMMTRQQMYAIRLRKGEMQFKKRFRMLYDAKGIIIELRTTTYESNNQPYVSNTLKILSSVTRAFKQVLHVHVTTGAAIVVSRTNSSHYSVW